MNTPFEQCPSPRRPRITVSVDGGASESITVSSLVEIESLVGWPPRFLARVVGQPWPVPEDAHQSPKAAALAAMSAHWFPPVVKSSAE